MVIAQVNIALDALGAVVTAILLFNLLTETARSGVQQKNFIGMLAALLLILLTDAFDWSLNGAAAFWQPLYVSNTINYAAGYGMVLFFTRYLAEFLDGKNKLLKRLTRCGDSLFVLSVLLLLSNAVSGIFFTIDAAGVYQRGGLYWLSQLYPALALLGNAVAIAVFPALSRSERLVLGTYPLFPFVGIVIDFVWSGWALTYVGAFLSIFIVYIQLYVLRGKKLAEQENELTQARVNIMLSQIQPHFLYNVLSTITYLCQEDPKLAEKASIDFTEFLRGNMLSLTADKPIAFEQELAHTKRYLELEKLRFAENLNVVFDIAAMQFRLPTLTLQPIVENAVRYGVTKRVEGGTVTIAARETAAAFVVTVSDDGVGFDPEQTQSDGRTHIGIHNVRDRLKRVGGTLEIRSTAGVGTISTITIPKEAQQC